jgi:nitrite reductase/ring-hydroxylating ferredoxin subunit
VEGPGDSRVSEQDAGVYVCTLDEMPEGTIRRLGGDPPAILFRVEGELYATQEFCTHEEWSLAEDSELDGYEVECALHLARFDVRTGAAICLPATRPLQTYPVQVVDGKIFISR